MRWPNDPQNDVNDFYARVGQATQVGIGAMGSGGTAGIALGADVTLYRLSANELKTDDTFRSSQNIVAQTGGANMVNIGLTGLGAGLVFGSAADTNLYRSAANELKTDDAFYAAGNITTEGVCGFNTGVQWRTAGLEQLTVGAAGASAAPPATPTKYLKVRDSAGTTLVIPAYAAA